jgi:quercetin dioxygenase-like cupin family protein
MSGQVTTGPRLRFMIGVMVDDEHAIVNPLSGERIVIRQPAASTGGRLLSWELFLAPGGAVPSRHAHPEQEERFTVVDGRVRFRVGLRSIVVGPGGTVRVPPGTVHHFANAGPGQAHMAVETQPALEMEAMFRAAAALARDQQASGRAVPRPVDLVLFLREFRRELAAPYLPAPLLHLALRPLGWLANSLGVDRSYRRLRRLDGIAASA